MEDRYLKYCSHEPKNKSLLIHILNQQQYYFLMEVEDLYQT